jgi:hypothetical protein
MVAVYANCPFAAVGGCDPTVCPPCPLTAPVSTATLCGVAGDDNCINIFESAGTWDSASQLGRDALPGECFLIRIGSFPGTRGSGALSVECGGGGGGDATTPVVDPSGLNKSRFISFIVPPPATAAVGETALRVNFKTLHHVDPIYTNGASIPFTLFENQSQFVGPPVIYVESDSSQTQFYSSKLQCEPYYQDWTTIGLLHVTGEAIVPSSVYEVENLAASCLGSEDSCTAVSEPLSIATTRWGDVVNPFNPPLVPPDPPTPTTQPDFGDISSLVNKFKSAVGAPIKARALLAAQAGNTRGLIDLSVDLGFTHISADVDAFKGFPYPYKVGKCTGAAATACTTNADCGANGPCILCE